MVASGDVGLAFGLVFGAGAASCLGACIVFCVSLASPRLVAASLGFAAGVMLFVVFTEILMVDSYGAWQAASFSANAAYRLSFACFFGGVLITAALDVAVHALMHRAARHRQQKAEEVSSVCSASESTAGLVRSLPWSDGHAKPGAGQGDLQLGRIGDPIHSYEAVHSGSGPEDVETGRTGGSGMDCHGSPRSNTSGAGNACSTGTASACQAPARSCSECMHKDAHPAMPAPGTGSAQLMAVLQGDEHTNEMLQATLRSGMFTALVVALHNLPEGLASFVGGLNNSKVGASIAAAIAIHNIPEGICVAMPIYYATGSKWKGFMWGSLTGMAEPLGGLLGFLVLDQEEPLTFAVVFGIVAGMMVYVSVKELLPSAFRFDPSDKIASSSVLVGMAVIAFSLLLFTL
ncbi:hypothetical protein ABPG77_003279 [Micractinium sp. CCAP 211/92]